MDFRIPKAQPYFSGYDRKLMMNVNNNPEEKDAQTTKISICRELQLKSSVGSSSEALDKEVVLRRIRHHKRKTKVRGAFQGLVDSLEQAQEKWMQLGDAFTCP